MPHEEMGEGRFKCHSREGLKYLAISGLRRRGALPSYGAMESALTAAPPAAARPVGAPLVATRGRVRLRTLLVIRWVGIAGQAAALMIVHYGLGYPLPIAWAGAVVGASAALNLWLMGQRRGSALLSDRTAAIQLGYDMLQLAALLYLTGGLGNPFAILILAPVIVSATVLSRRSTVSLSLLALAGIVLLARFHMPLPWPNENFRLEPVFILGLALALALSVLFIAAYVLSVAEEARRLSDALSATQMALDRERQLSAVGALAAAAAHELGTPLGTIALVAHEIARDLPKDSALATDVELLLSESRRCKKILAELAARPDTDNQPFGPLPVGALIEAAAIPYRRPEIGFRIEGQGELPSLPASPELSHGLGTLLQNAFEFARHEVVVKLAADEREFKVTISDDGPGFDTALLDQLGEPYVSRGNEGRKSQGEHMGLGVFIAVTLLSRTGADLHFGNRPAGGGEVVLTWNRSQLGDV
jgi:two-component system sensor histidine kinase RegB